MSDATSGDAPAHLPDAPYDAYASLLPDAKPELIINTANLPETAVELGKRLAGDTTLFERGTPVRVVHDKQRNCVVAEPLDVNAVVIAAHQVCRPVEDDAPSNQRGRKGVTLPERVGRLYLADRSAWGLPILDGITSAPLLSDDGRIRATDGYDGTTRMWCHNVPPLSVPEFPSREDADASILALRQLIQTIAFADAERINLPGEAVPVVDVTEPPGLDESTLLVALMTAVCRASLQLAPALLIRAPSYSGAGVGKGLLVRLVSEIAFGQAPHAMTAGETKEELDKRLVSALIKAGSVIFLDNLNGTNLKSDTLASAITERPAHVRILGSSTTRSLNASAFIAVTGNGLSLSEDLARRFLVVELDAGIENPEARAFRTDLLAEARERRAELLSHVLTIWRWGRQHHNEIEPGRPLGSFADWARWCRDPLLALGCMDPVERIASIKDDDPLRKMIAEFFSTWSERHGDMPVTVAHLDPDVTYVADPSGRQSRQWLATFVGNLVGTRAGGFVLKKLPKTSKWPAGLYVLERVTAPERTVPEPKALPPKQVTKRDPWEDKLIDEDEEESNQPY